MNFNRPVTTVFSLLAVAVLAIQPALAEESVHDRLQTVFGLEKEADFAFFQSATAAIWSGLIVVAILVLALNVWRWGNGRGDASEALRKIILAIAVLLGVGFLVALGTTYMSGSENAVQSANELNTSLCSEIFKNNNCGFQTENQFVHISELWNYVPALQK